MDLDQFVASLKPFTKIMLIGIAATAVVATTQIISPVHYVMHFPDSSLHVG